MKLMNITITILFYTPAQTLQNIMRKRLETHSSRYWLERKMEYATKKGLVI